MLKPDPFPVAPVCVKFACVTVDFDSEIDFALQRISNNNCKSVDEGSVPLHKLHDSRAYTRGSHTQHTSCFPKSTRTMQDFSMVKQLTARVVTQACSIQSATCSDRRRQGEPRNRCTRCDAQGSLKHVRNQCACNISSFWKVQNYDAVPCMTGMIRTAHRYYRSHTTPSWPRCQDRLRRGTLQGKGTRSEPNRNPAICNPGDASSLNRMC